MTEVAARAPPLMWKKDVMTSDRVELRNGITPVSTEMLRRFGHLRNPMRLIRQHADPIPMWRQASQPSPFAGSVPLSGSPTR